MSEERFLLLFLGADPGWLRLADGRVIARGAELAAAPPPAAEEGAPERVVLVTPGVDAAIHWADIPASLSPPQAAGAARIMASEVSAQPLDSLHVAVGPSVEGDNERCLAIVAEEHMAAWLAEAQALGHDPDRVVPEPLLLLAPEEGLRRFSRAGMDNLRGRKRAFTVEPELGALLLGDSAVEPVDAERFEAELGEALLAAPVNLRQGRFAKRRRWRIDWLLVRRLVAIAGGILLVTLLVQLTLITKYSFAADRLELETANRAREALPSVDASADIGAQLGAALDTAGGGASYSAIAGAVFAAVRETPEAEVQSVIFQPDRSLQLEVSAPSQAELDALVQRMTAAGLAVEPGATRDGGGRRIGAFIVRAA